MDRQYVRKILRQIADGNHEFDRNSAEVTRILGNEPTHERTEGEAEILRSYLDSLEASGYVRAPVKSSANYWMVDLTPRGAALLEELCG